MTDDQYEMIEFDSWDSDLERLAHLLRKMGATFDEHQENGITRLALGTMCREPRLTFDSGGSFIGYYDGGSGVWYPVEAVEQLESDRRE